MLFNVKKKRKEKVYKMSTKRITFLFFIELKGFGFSDTII